MFAILIVAVSYVLAFAQLIFWHSTNRLELLEIFPPIDDEDLADKTQLWQLVRVVTSAISLASVVTLGAFLAYALFSSLFIPGHDFGYELALLILVFSVSIFAGHMTTRAEKSSG